MLVSAVSRKMVMARLPGTRRTGTTGWPGCPRGERMVLELIGEGLTNR
jgi:hypothetical protein